MDSEKHNVTVLETDLECSLVTCGLSHGPQFSPLYLTLVRTLKTVMGLPLVNTFSAYVEKLGGSGEEQKQRAKGLIFFFI